MKKLLVFAALAVFGLTTVNAQEDSTVDKVVEQAKNGGFYIGANVGFSLISSNFYNSSSNNDDYGSFNFGFDAAYLFGVMENLEVGLLTGYTQFIASGKYSYNDNGTTVHVDYKDASFVPIAASSRYSFADGKFFGGLDLGVGINVDGDSDTGFYYRPKFGFNLGNITLIASYQGISGDQNYNNSNGAKLYSLNGFKSVNAGIEFSL